MALILDVAEEEPLYLTLPDGREVMLVLCFKSRGNFKVIIAAPDDVVIERDRIRQKRLAAGAQPVE